MTKTMSTLRWRGRKENENFQNVMNFEVRMVFGRCYRHKKLCEHLKNIQGATKGT